jgi:CRISPR type I-E-associated protein CasA/Cse1
VTTRPTFPLHTSAWIPLMDRTTGANVEVGITEALTRAHELSLHDASDEGIAVLRLLAAVLDAAAGPRTVKEWDAAWKAPALPVERITAYLEQWADRLDLLHPEHPAFQCAALGADVVNRGPAALHPASLGGSGAAWFNKELYDEDSMRPWTLAEAARRMLWLLAYDVAGIKPALPDDPKGSKSKIYGGHLGPLGFATHIHVQAPGSMLKDLLLLNLPPQKRAKGDMPVWEREAPGPFMRERVPTGRLDVWTWPTRRIRLHASPIEDRPGELGVKQIALYDGDRATGPQPAWGADPMTAWSVYSSGKTGPQQLLDASDWPKPWPAARLLHSPTPSADSSTVIDHVVAAASRKALPADLWLRVVMSVTLHANRHKSTIAAIPTPQLPLGTVGQLADPDQRTALARRARAADALAKDVVQRTVKATLFSADQLKHRLALTGMEVEDAWEKTIVATGRDVEEGRRLWRAALLDMVDRGLDQVPLNMMQRAKLKADVRKHYPSAEAQDAAAEAAKSAPRKRRPTKGKVTRYDVFGGSYTISQISRMPECVVSYITLKSRVEEKGWDIHTAATTPGGRGGPRRHDTPDDPDTSSEE